jgi:hypothetical protein
MRAVRASGLVRTCAGTRIRVQDRQAEPADNRPGAWQCPSCGRNIPRHVEVCRCGSERRRLEALGYKLQSAQPAVRAAAAPRRQAEHHGLATTLVGYQLDTDLATGWRMVLKAFFVVAVVGVAVALVRFTHTDPLPIRDNIQILDTLDGFTRTAEPQAGNTIPLFIASTGRLGVLGTSGTPDDPVRELQASELAQGFCSQSVAKQVRYEFPGYYEQWPDDKLERVVLKKYPEYAERLCLLSHRLDASADQVIKYELKPRTLVGHATLWSRTVLLTILFAVICLNVYYRMIVGRLLSPAEA